MVELRLEDRREGYHAPFVTEGRGVGHATFELPVRLLNESEEWLDRVQIGIVSVGSIRETAPPFPERLKQRAAVKERARMAHERVSIKGGLDPFEATTHMVPLKFHLFGHTAGTFGVALYAVWESGIGWYELTGNLYTTGDSASFHHRPTLAFVAPGKVIDVHFTSQ